MCESGTITHKKALEDQENILKNNEIPLSIANGKISVTYFSNQIWCEYQLLYKLVTKLQIETEATKRGIKRHEQLELESHSFEEVTVSCVEELMGIKLLNTVIQIEEIFQTNKKVREVWVFYPLDHDIIIRGIIDEICVDVNGDLLLKDTKTRAELTIPPDSQKQSSALQLGIYAFIIDKLRKASSEDESFEAFYDLYKCDKTKPFELDILQPYKNLKNMLKLYLESFKKLPTKLNYAEIEYDCEGTIFHIERIPIKKINLSNTLNYLLEWWYGERNATKLTTHETYKCKHCAFIDICQYTPLSVSEKNATIAEKYVNEDIEDLISDD